MSITKSQNARVMSEEAIQYLCKCINLVNSLPTSVIDNLHLADNLTFSSTKIDRLLTTLKEDCNKYTDSIVANLSRLELKVVTDEADMIEHNKLYLIKKAGETSYSQYVIVTNDSGVDEKILLGTCDISMTDYLKITDADSTYCKKTDFDTLKTEVDKVKTEIGSDTLTTTAQTLKGGINEVNTNKANASEVVKKTDITTTIDSTSTDTQVPSAKSVYDNIQNKNTMQPSGTMAKYSTVFDWAVNNAGATCPYEGDNLADCPLKNTWGTLVCIGIKVDNGLKVLAYQNDNKYIYIRTIVRRNNGTNEWVEPKWQRLCTTSVADVPVTTVDFIGTDIHGSVKYLVKSGICYVSAWGISSDTAKTAHRLVGADVMPKPSIYSGTTLVHGDTSQNGKLVGQLYIDDIGALSLHIYPNAIGNIGFGSFSYPVAES